MTDLFSIKGRIGRKNYWIGIGILAAIRIAGIVVATSLEDGSAVFRSLDLLTLMTIMLVGSRLHDFGWSALWGWAAMAAIVICSVAVVVVIDDISPDEIKSLMGLLTFAPTVLLIVCVGLIKSDPEANRFGPPTNSPLVVANTSESP